MTTTPPHCTVPAHAGFPLPCVRCANPVFELPRAGSLRRLHRATTTAESHARRSEFDVAAMERARLSRVTGAERALAGIPRNPALRRVR